MKKILTQITKEEKDECVALTALLETYRTLLRIERYEFDKQQLKDLVFEYEIKLQRFWKRIIDKYTIPLYVDRQMKIDHENNYIYVVM